jgi:BirA family transcriptional regulator, biotin operon repressor / biotin---[acetyl-CoA-carboxylase] ligase
MTTPSPFTSNNILVLSEIDSTNSYALRALHEGKLGHGAVIQALHQTEGRGQRSNKWENEAGKDLLLSIIIEPQQYGIKQVVLLNMAVCVSLHKLLSAYTKDVTIKWSNDIYVKDNKVSGVLIENTWRGEHWNYAVIGIGVNVNSTHLHAKGLQATAINTEHPAELNIDNLRQELLQLLEEHFMLCTADAQLVIDTYNAHLKSKNQQVIFEIDGKPVMATIKRVDEDGRIVLKISNALRKFAYGEAKWVV